MHTFTPHILKTVKQAKAKVNILLLLAGFTWGQDKETILMTHRAIVQRRLEYGSVIWSPIICQSNWDQLQGVSNSGYRLAWATVFFLKSKVEDLPLVREPNLY